MADGEDPAGSSDHRRHQFGEGRYGIGPQGEYPGGLGGGNAGFPILVLCRPLDRKIHRGLPRPKVFPLLRGTPPPARPQRTDGRAGPGQGKNDPERRQSHLADRL